MYKYTYVCVYIYIHMYMYMYTICLFVFPSLQICASLFLCQKNDWDCQNAMMESLLIETDETRSDTDSDWVTEWVVLKKFFAVWDFEARSYSPLGPTPAEKQARPCRAKPRSAQKHPEAPRRANGSAGERRRVKWISFCRCAKFAGHGEGCKREERGPAWLRSVGFVLKFCTN